MGIHPDTIRLLLELELADLKWVRDQLEIVRKDENRHWELEHLEEIETLTQNQIRKIQNGQII